MVQLLIKHGADTHSRTGVPQKTPMQLAAAGGHLDIMEELVKKGMDWKEKDDWGWTLLHEVASAKDAAGIKWVSLRCRGLSNIPEKLGRTPLLTALIAGAAVDAISQLLDHGEDPGTADDVGRTTAEAAVLYCSSAVVKLIIEACIKQNEKVEADEKNQITATYDEMIVFDKGKLLLIAEDHPEGKLVRKIIETLLP